MVSKGKLLLVDDDVATTESLGLYLGQAGYEVRTAGNGAEGLGQFLTAHPDLVLLDIMMPQMDGWGTCKCIRALSSLPIIMLTACAQESECIRVLAMGADDYVCKPCALAELEARIEAVLRRTGGTQKGAMMGKARVIGDLLIDPNHWEVRCQGQLVAMTATELRLLFYLAENAGRVVSHRQILEQVWGTASSTSDYYPKLFISHLRQKIEPDPTNPRYILTKRGIGYCMPPRL
jgi:DNA-binding response OmpR family regulator